MPNKTSIAPMIVGALAIIGAVLILLLYDGTDKIVVAGLYVTIVGGVFGYLQSTMNSAKITAIAPAVQDATKALAQIAPAVAQIAPLVDQVTVLDGKADETSGAVNGAVTKWMTAVAQIAAMQATIAAQEKRIAVTEALQRGAEQGKRQLLDDTAAMAVATANDPSAQL